MEKYLLTAHDVSDEWIEIKKIIENTNDCELLEMVCDIEIQHIQTYYRRMA